MWREAAVESRLSDDGRLIVDHHIGVWGDDPEATGRWVVIRDARSGDMLLDTAAVQHQRLYWRDDGAILVRLSDYQRQAMLRIDPASRSFRDLAADGPADGPLSGLQSGFESAARRIHALPAQGEAMDFTEREFSPDGRFRIDYDIQSWRMSHETRSPTLIDIADGARLLSLTGDWDGSAQWLPDGQLRIGLRRYTIGGWVSVTLDPVGRRGRIDGEEGASFILPGGEPTIERAFERSRKQAPKSAAIFTPQASIGRQFLNLLMAIGIAAILFALAWVFFGVSPTKAPFVPPSIPRLTAR